MKNTDISCQTRACFRCKIEKPATLEYFYSDKGRPLGLSYECRPCLSARKKGRDRRSERWSNMTPDQRTKKKERAQKYGKTDKGRACFLRQAYKRIDDCDLSTDEIAAIIRQPCSHCGTEFSPRGLDRIDNKLPHIKGNVIPSCAACNIARGDRFTLDEMKVIGAAIRKVMQDRLSCPTPNAAHL